MPGRIDITGKRFGRFVALRKAPSRSKHTYWLCRCDCGAEVVVRTDALTRGRSKSCGCYHQDVVTTHGMRQSDEYGVWKSMIDRCGNPNGQAYQRYGERGISVCERWHDFEAFYEDMGPRPDGLTLDRIDNDGDYSPGNCRWATPKEQGRNRNDNRILSYKGNEQCLSEWAEQMGMKYSTLRERLRRGWTVTEALETPVDLGGRWKRISNSAKFRSSASAA